MLVRALASKGEERAVDELTIDLAPSSPVPLYHQVASQLEAAITGGKLPKGHFLPSEIDLAERWGVSRPTARRAIQELVAKGLLVRRRGVGTQVISEQVRRPVQMSSLYDDLELAGRSPTTEVVACAVVPADLEVAEALELPSGSEVLYVERVRSAEGRPLALMHNWIAGPEALDMTVEELTSGGLYDRLRARNVRPHDATQTIGATTATAEQGERLSVPVGAPLLTMHRVMKDSTGRLIETARHVYDATRYTVEMTVREEAG